MEVAPSDASNRVDRAADCARVRNPVGVSAKTARIVSLNCRMLANPLANAIRGIWQFRRLDQDPSGLRALGTRQRDRSGADFGDELTVQVALTEVELPGQTRDSLSVDDAVGNQPHRSTDEVRALVPLRRSGSGVRAAPLARPVAGELGRGGRGVEPHVRPLGRARRAARPAVDPGAGHGTEEPPVKAGVPALDRPVALFLVLEHGTSVTGRRRTC